MHGGFDSSVLVLLGEDNDTAAPTPVHLQLEPVGAGCELLEWSDSSRQLVRQPDTVTTRGVDWDTTDLL